MSTDSSALWLLIPSESPPPSNYLVITSGLQEEVGEVFFFFFNKLKASCLLIQLRGSHPAERCSGQPRGFGGGSEQALREGPALPRQYRGQGHVPWTAWDTRNALSDGLAMAASEVQHFSSGLLWGLVSALESF